MKKLQTLFVLSLLLFTSCTKEKKQNDVTITGHITDYATERDDVTLIIKHLGLDNDSRIRLTLDKEGSFTHTAKLFMPSDIRIQSNSNKVNFQILAHPGDNIKLTFNNENSDFWESLSFEGDRSIENIQITNFQETYRKNRISNSTIHKAQHKDFADFETFMDSVKQVSLQILDNFITQNETSTEVSEWCKWMTYETYFYNMSEYISNNNPKGIDANPYDFLNTILPQAKSELTATYSLNLFANIYNFGYLGELRQNLVNKFRKTYNAEMTPAEIKDLEDEYHQQELQMLINNCGNSLIKEIVIALKISNLLVNKDTSAYTNHRELILAEIENSGIKKSLYQQYIDTKFRLENPITQNDLLNRTKGTTVSSMLDSIFTQNKHKVVIFDFWGPYCSPCFRAFPQLNKLIEDYSEEPIQFVFFCLDGESNKKRYNMLIDKYALKGIKISLDKKQTQEMKKLFEIGAIPHQTLFDKNGNMRENGRGSHHIDDKINEWINE